MLKSAKQAAALLAVVDTKQKNEALSLLALAIRYRRENILSENDKDVASACAAGQTSALVDRLTLTPSRIEDMARAVEHIITLPDPIGEVHDLSIRPNGLRVGRMRIPLGVIGIIYEARPNVAADASALCLKSGNAVVLRGGSDAANSNRILGEIIQEAVVKAGLPPASVQVMDDFDRELVLYLLQARDLVDLIIPRGGESLIRFVDENARVSTILHYKGVCHVYVDKDADLEKALPIVLNAKVQRPGVCNAMETLLIHKDVAVSFLPLAAQKLVESGVELRGCEKAREIVPGMKEATRADWEAEYLDLVLSVRIVDDIDMALKHIAEFGSSHTESIITENLSAAGRFLRDVQSSCVLVNASTRFNDGGELGLGAEIGISTTKLHAFGPMGLRELTASKFVVLGNGQIRQ